MQYHVSFFSQMWIKSIADLSQYVCFRTWPRFLAFTVIVWSFTASSNAQHAKVISIGSREWALDSNGSPYAFRTALSRRVLRFEVRDRDQRIGDGRQRERSELRTIKELPHGSLVDVSFAMRVEKLSLGHRFQILSQWHTKAAKGWGPWLSFRYSQPGKLLAIWSSSTTDSVISKSKSVTRGSQEIDCDIGEWCNIHFIVRTDQANGFLYVFKNGKKFVSYHGPIGYFTAPYGKGAMGYMKVGIYRWHREGGARTVVSFRDLHVSVQ